MSEKEWICKNCLKVKNEVVKLKMFRINFKEAIYMCMDKKCSFPFYEGRAIYDYIVEHKSDITDSEESDEDDGQSSSNLSTGNPHNGSITDSSSIVANEVSSTKFAENDILKTFDTSASNSSQEHCTKNLLNTDSNVGLENLSDAMEELERAIDREIDLMHALSDFNSQFETASGGAFSDVPSPESGITEEYDQDNMLAFLMGNGTNSYQQKKATCAEASVLEPKDKTAIDNFLSENVNVFDAVNHFNQESALMELGQSNSTKSWLSEDSITMLKKSGAEECIEKERVLLEDSTSKLKGDGIKNSTGKNSPPSAKCSPELESAVGQKFTKKESRIDLKEDDQIFIIKKSALPKENPGKLKETSVQKCTEQKRLLLKESCVEQNGACGNEILSSDKNPTAQDQNLFLPKRSTRARKKICTDYHYY